MDDDKKEEFPLRINVRDITSKGLDVAADLSIEYMGLTKDDYVHFITPLHVTAHVNKFDTTILSNVQVSGRFESFCSRSLERLERDWQDKFTLDFEFDNTVEFINLGEDIRQEVILRLPVRLLSEKEEAKAKSEKEKSEQVDSDIGEEKTYQPFKNLKLGE